MNAQRSNNGNYTVGNLFVCPITEEEYNEILAEVGSEVRLSHGQIIYMHRCSEETLNKYASKVLNSPMHKDKSIEDYDKQIKELEGKIQDLKIYRNALTNLMLDLNSK